MCDITIGGKEAVIIAGSCAIENEYQALTVAIIVRKNKAIIFRCGAFKPRTSPYNFRGLGKEGLKILAKVREVTGLPVITEPMDHNNFEKIEQYVDIVQIGAHNI